MRASLAFRQDRRGSRLDSNDLDIRILCLQVLAGAGNGAAGANASNKDINLALGLLPDFRTGGVIMHLRVGRIDELTQNHCVLDGLFQFLRLCNRALHAGGTGCQNDFCAISSNQLAALNGHGFRHGQDDMIALCGTNGSQTNARVAGGRLDDGCTRLQNALCLCVRDHCVCNTILDASCRIEVLQLCNDFCVQVVCLFKIYQFQQRRIADQFCNALLDSHNKNASFHFSLSCRGG